MRTLAFAKRTAKATDQNIIRFLGFAFLNIVKCVNALIDSKLNLHFALISTKSPPWVIYSICF